MFRFRIREVLWLTVVAGLGCTQQPRGNVAPNPAFDEQAEAFDRQTQEHNRLLADQEKTLRRAEALMAKQESEAQRMERILDKLEEQAKRKDAILDAEERQLGIKK